MVSSEDVRLHGANDIPVNGDSMSKCLISMELEHHEIHAGDHYFIQNFAADLTSTAVLAFGLIVPTIGAGSCHMTWEVASIMRHKMSVLENATFTAGTTLTCNNNNRNSGNISFMNIQSSITAYTGTTLLTYQRGASGGGAQPAQAGIARRDRELILKSNSKYAFIITNLDASNTISYEANWYEEG